MTKEDEVDARRKGENDEGKRDDDEQGGQLPVAFDVLSLQRRRVELDLSATRTNGHGNDVRVADAHDGERTEIVDDQMNTLPLRIDVTRIRARGVAFDLAGRSTIAVQEQNVTVQSETDAGQDGDVVLGVFQSAVGLLPLWPVEIQSAV